MDAVRQVSRWSLAWAVVVVSAAAVANVVWPRWWAVWLVAGVAVMLTGLRVVLRTARRRLERGVELAVASSDSRLRGAT